MGQQTCVCGHSREPHEHYRRGSDCSLCAQGQCPRFRVEEGTVGRWRSLAAALRAAARS